MPAARARHARQGNLRLKRGPCRRRLCCFIRAGPLCFTAAARADVRVPLQCLPVHAKQETQTGTSGRNKACVRMTEAGAQTRPRVPISHLDLIHNTFPSSHPPSGLDSVGTGHLVSIKGTSFLNPESSKRFRAGHALPFPYHTPLQSSQFRRAESHLPLQSRSFLCTDLAAHCSTLV